MRDMFGRSSPRSSALIASRLHIGHLDERVKFTDPDPAREHEPDERIEHPKDCRLHGRFKAFSH